MTKEEVLERLVGAYTAYFNIRRDTELNGLPVAMDAEYHVRNEQYVLSREAKLWEAENDEYAFVVVLEELDPENLRAYYDAVLKEGMSRVDPRANHMRTDITMLVLADRIQPEAAASSQKAQVLQEFSLYPPGLGPVSSRSAGGVHRPDLCQWAGQGGAQGAGTALERLTSSI